MRKFGLDLLVLNSASQRDWPRRVLLRIAEVGRKQVFQASSVSASARQRLQAAQAQGSCLLRGVGELRRQRTAPSPADVHLQSTCCGSSLWAPV